MNDNKLIQAPVNIEVEKQLLGLLLTDAKAFAECQNILSPEVFYNTYHNEIYRACQQISILGSPINSFAVSQQLSTNGTLAKVGGDSYLLALQAMASFSVSGKELAMILFQKYLRRQIIEGCQNSLKKAYDETVDEFDILDDVRKNVLQIHSTLNKSSKRTLSDIVDSYYEKIVELLNSGGGISGIKTYIPALDNRLGGLGQGRMVTIAARPGMGKTALLIQIIVNVCLLNDKKTFVVYSLEMTGEEIINRIVSCIIRYPYDRIANGDIDVSMHSKFEKTLSYIRGLKNLHIVDNINDIDEIAMDLKAKADESEIHGFMVDYLQLAKAKAVKQGNREQVVSHISQTMKNTAKELRMPGVALCQLNRESEKTATKKPELSNLRESGSLEQDSDSVTFIFRSLYAGVAKDDDGMAISENDCEFLTRKNRHGKTGDDKVWCDISCNIFRDPQQPYSTTARNYSESQKEQETPF